MTHEQPAWVLLTASADRKVTPEQKGVSCRHPIQNDKLLLEQRSINNFDPHLLKQKIDKTEKKGGKPAKTAVILTGELRCLHRSRGLLLSIGKSADLFIVTTAAYRADALSLTSKSNIKIVDDCNDMKREERRLNVNSMKQWHKLKIGLEMIEKTESETTKSYRFILKIRSDYYFVHPERLIHSFEKACRQSQTGIIGSSDKVFGGRRDYMMLFKGFHAALLGSFDGKENYYWPINLKQILSSDDSYKWFGFKWPKKLVGEPKNLVEWRENLENDQTSLTHSLATYQNGTPDSLYSMLKGHEQFSSEICFAKFLNYTGIKFNELYDLRGFLCNDRNST